MLLLRKMSILLIGDSRARWFGMTKAKPSSVVIRSEKGMNIVHLMKLMEKKDLWEKKQLIILMGLHCDFTRLLS